MVTNGCTERNLIDALEAERLRRNLTLRRFAKVIGMSPAMYLLWHKGDRKPSKQMLRRVGEVYPDLVTEDVISQAR